MKTNRLFALLSVSALLISLCGCGVSQESAADTNPAATEAQLLAEPTLPFKETINPAAETTEPVTEPTQEQTVPTETEIPFETTMPVETMPAEHPTKPVADTAPNQPAETQPAATEPKETGPAVTEPKETQPPATEPQPTVPAENPYVNEAGQTVYYDEGGGLVWGLDENGEPFSYIREPKVYVTPATIRASDWNSWDFDKQSAFQRCFRSSIKDPEVLHNYYKATKYDDYDCGYEGHACCSEDYHEELMKDLATPCDYCGETNCVSWLALEPDTLFTKYDSEACPKYDKTKDPFFYCQVCHKTRWGKPSESCSQYLADVNCYTCGEPVKAHACHTCAFDEDIYDEYKKEFIN